MRKKICGIIAIIVCFGAFVGSVSWGHYATNHYHKLGTVTTVYKDTILIEDIEGDVWEVYADDLKAGDNVKMTMFTNLTRNNFYDDVVEKVEIKR